MDEVAYLHETRLDGEPKANRDQHIDQHAAPQKIVQKSNHRSPVCCSVIYLVPKAMAATFAPLLADCLPRPGCKRLLALGQGIGQFMGVGKYG
uniref:Uncharacterized protein n=1 Tax=Aquisalinus luteolus TaxID=1566827 RepID=A0A8J3EQD0_9PROT|nr:hypothetical protein GCM10011355_08320 [Aquisalinus luteolus]